MDEQPAGGAQLVNWSHNTLTLNFCNQMFLADTGNNWERYFKATLWFLNMNEAYLTDDERLLLEKDYDLMAQKIKEAKEHWKTNDSTCQMVIKEIKIDFADTHRALGFLAFSRSGIIYPAADGEIDFEKLPLAITQQIIQAPFGLGLEKAATKTMAQVDELKKAEGKQDGP